MAFRKLFFKRVQGIRDNYLLQEGDIALDESDFKLYRGDGETVGGVVISGAGGGSGIALTDISVTQASASGAGTLAYNSSTGVFTYTPPTASGLGAKTSVSEADVTQHQAALSITESQISDLGTYVTASSTTTFTNKSFDADGTGNTITNIDLANLKSDVLDTDLSSVSGADDTIASAKAIKAYVDANSGGGGSSLQSRTTKAGTTGSLADAAQENLDITGFKGYALLKVQTDRAARVRIYTDAASRTADASRAEGSDPAADDGVIAEVITTAAETVLISPGAFGFNNESTPTTTIPCRVTNKSGSSSTVTVTLHVLQLES